MFRIPGAAGTELGLLAAEVDCPDDGELQDVAGRSAEAECITVPYALADEVTVETPAQMPQLVEAGSEVLTRGATLVLFLISMRSASMWKAYLGSRDQGQ